MAITVAGMEIDSWQGVVRRVKTTVHQLPEAVWEDAFDLIAEHERGLAGCEEAEIADRLTELLGALVDLSLAAGARDPGGPPPPPPPPAAEELLDLFHREQRRRGVLPSSIDKRERCIRRFAHFLRGRPLLAATKADVEAWCDSLRVTDNTWRNYLSHLHAFYGWAGAEGRIEVSPTAFLRGPKARPRRPRPIPDADLQIAIRTAGGDLRCFLLLAAYQGLRCCEIAGLEVENVRIPEGQLYVTGKGDKERMLPLHPEVAAALGSLPMPRRGRVFHLADGRPLRPHNVSHAINRHLTELKMDSTAHQLRHWFATKMMMTTHDLRTVQELLGHQSPVSTAVYTAFDREGAAAAVAGLTVM